MVPPATSSPSRRMWRPSALGAVIVTTSVPAVGILDGYHCRRTGRDRSTGHDAMRGPGLERGYVRAASRNSSATGNFTGRSALAEATSSARTA